MTSKVKGVIAGNFDVIHSGYVNMFNEAAKNCDQLYVALHDDPTVERPHKAKLILSVEERMIVNQIISLRELIIPLRFKEIP